jgi:hypothetical protein
MENKIVYISSVGKKKYFSPFRIWINQHPEYCTNCDWDRDCRICAHALYELGPTIRRVPEQWDLFYAVMARHYQLYVHKDERLDNHPLSGPIEKDHRIIEGRKNILNNS